MSSVSLTTTAESRLYQITCIDHSANVKRCQ